MIELKRTATLGLALVLAGAGATRAADAVRMHGPAKAAAEIAAADGAFNDRAAAVGAPTAFGEVMDPQDGRYFLPGADPVQGAAAIATMQRTETGAGKLAWAPSEVFASTGGDMGVSWGRWSFTPPGARAPLVTGRYQTTWRKDADGRWKALTDIGLPDPPPSTPPH